MHSYVNRGPLLKKKRPFEKDRFGDSIQIKIHGDTSVDEGSLVAEHGIAEFLEIAALVKPYHLRHGVQHHLSRTHRIVYPYRIAYRPRFCLLIFFRLLVSKIIARSRIRAFSTFSTGNSCPQHTVCRSRISVGNRGNQWVFFENQVAFHHFQSKIQAIRQGISRWIIYLRYAGWPGHGRSSAADPGHRECRSPRYRSGSAARRSSPLFR